MISHALKLGIGVCKSPDVESCLLYAKELSLQFLDPPYIGWYMLIHPSRGASG